MDKHLLTQALCCYVQRVPIHSRTVVFCPTAAIAHEAMVLFDSHDVASEMLYAGILPQMLEAFRKRLDCGETLVVFCGPAALKQPLPRLFNCAIVLARTEQKAVHESHYALLREDCPAISRVFDFTDNVARHGFVEGSKAHVFRAHVQETA